MNEFVLIFRRDFSTKETQPSPQELQDSLKLWQDWLGGIAAQDKLAKPLQRWDGEGKIVIKNKSSLSRLLLFNIISIFQTLAFEKRCKIYPIIISI